MQVQNLRVYERRGLVDPDRTPGGTRLYSHDDLDRLARIRDLLAEGLNLAGIARVLALEAEVARLVRVNQLLRRSDRPDGRDAGDLSGMDLRGEAVPLWRCSPWWWSSPVAGPRRRARAGGRAPRNRQSPTWSARWPQVA